MLTLEETSLYKYICISLDGHSTLQKEKFTWKQITLTLLNKLCKIASGKKVRQRIKKKQQQQQQRKERKKNSNSQSLDHS